MENSEFDQFYLVMALKLNVPSIVCDGCAQTITESINTMEPDAQVNVDVKAKTVTVESEASEETIKQAIVAAGHTVEGYQAG
ncbi:heavy-metal-associated domain-containing protein [Gloeocapsopsis crepidinum]